jgi:WD40 repeat protein
MEEIIVSFNQSQDCVCFGTTNGFYIFGINPFKKSLAREIKGGVSIVKILYKTNIILFVGREPSGDYPNSKLILWDDANRKVIGEIQFRERILNAELNKEIIVVSTSKKIYIYKFENIECIKTIVTVNNSDGLFAIGGEKSDYIVYNGNEIGSIGITKIYEDYYREIKIHKAHIGCIRLSGDGKFIATASDTGTLIRIYNIENGDMIREVRRGSDPAIINDIKFNRDNSMIVVGSDRGTIHLFNTGIVKGGVYRNEEFSGFGLGYFKFALPSYFSSEWSFSRIHLSEEWTNSCFNGENTIWTIGSSGNCYQIEFNKEGKMEILKTIKFISDDSDPFSNRTNTIR